MAPLNPSGEGPPPKDSKFGRGKTSLPPQPNNNGNDDNIRCANNYPQRIKDDNLARIAYWKCDAVVTNPYCYSTIYFKGCERNLCDMHCRKLTEFRYGKRNDRFVKREYLLYKTCYNCFDKFDRALETKAKVNMYVCWSVGALTVVIILAIVIYAIVHSKNSS